MSSINGIGVQRYIATQTNKPQNTAKVRQTSGRATSDIYVPGDARPDSASAAKGKELSAELAYDLTRKYDVNSLNRANYGKLLGELRNAGVLTDKEYNDALSGRLPYASNNPTQERVTGELSPWPIGEAAGDYVALLENRGVFCEKYGATTAKTQSEKADSESLAATYKRLSQLFDQIDKATSADDEGWMGIGLVGRYRATNPELEAANDPVAIREFTKEGAKWRSDWYTQTEDGLCIPKNYVVVAEIDRNVSRDIEECFSRYYRGSASPLEVEEMLKGIVSDLRDYYVGLGYNEEDVISGIIEDVYEDARLEVIRTAASESWEDSLPIAAQHNGHTLNTQDWLYYDADYYYSSEELKSELQKMMYGICDDYSVTDLELPIEYPKGDIRRNIYNSYNTILTDKARFWGIGSIIDETMAPPKGFKFFYKGGPSLLKDKLEPPQDEPEAHFDGVLQVWYGDWSFTGRVPVRMDPNRFPISVNLFDVINNADPGGAPCEIVDFLQNVDFFAKYMTSRYTRTHPRNN